MDLIVFTPNEALVVLRALRAVTTAEGRFSESEAAFIETLGRLHGLTIDAHELEPIELAEVAAGVVDPHRRKRAVQLAIVASMIDGEPDPKVDIALRALANALEVPEAGVRVVHELANQHALLARFDMARRMRRFVSRTEGLIGTLRIALPMLGFPLEDRALVTRFKALEALPAGTLGRALFDHYVENGFAWPGDAGGVPERFLFHDVGHILSGYGVDPQGEIQQAAFQAGFLRHDGFFFLMFGIMQFHLGMKLTPVAAPETGYFDTERVLLAAARGAQCKVDLSDGFDPFAHAHEQIADLRERFGIPPLVEPVARVA